MASDDLARFEQLLRDHAYVPSGLRGVSRCACGIQFHGMPADHRSHVAALVAAECSEAARQAAEGMRAVAVAMIEGAAMIHDRNADWREGMDEAADLVREIATGALRSVREGS